MTPDELAAIKARTDAASEGPWEADEWEINGAEWVAETYDPDDHGKSRVNGNFIAHARQDVPALLAEVERLTQHSTTLNTIAFLIAQALGDVTPGADHVEGNPLELAERLIADRDILDKDFAALRDEFGATSIALDVAQAALHRIHDRAGLDGNASLVTITEHALRNERFESPLWVCAVCAWTSSESEPCPQHGHTGAPWCCDTCKTTAAVLDAEIVEADRA